MKNKTNNLITEKSPYLQQHAKNPVNWFPWNEKAFKLAQKEHKPIFLSIGYSTCHWCHVMEQESFEDENVAALLNDYFIAIKVDREERPDIDNVYMTVTQSLTGRGGWPNTVLMTPEKKPFYAGTYFPKHGFGRRPGMIEIINYFGKEWQKSSRRLVGSANKITKELEQFTMPSSHSNVDERVIDKAFRNLQTSFDNNNSGFGPAPKFPAAHNLMFLLRYWKKTNDSNALKMVENTLTKMRMGGIFDHIGFGFHRYSTDAQWLVPHFEKMLYDQAMLAIAYIETYQATQKNLYSQTAEEILIYVNRELKSGEGGFYSAEDADSEGEEGRFYLWDVPELDSLLTTEEKTLFKKYYNISAEGNFSEESTGRKNGKNIPHLGQSITKRAAESQLDKKELSRKLKLIREKLFENRETRIHPFKDKKIMTDWNGLMIAAFAKVGKILNQEKYIKIAENATRFIFKNLQQSDGTLLKRFCEGESAKPAHLNDYAFLGWGLLELYEATFAAEYLEKAKNLADQMITQFWDDKDHGFFIASSNNLILRSKDIYDGAVPSGNSVALMNIIKLYKITSDDNYKEKIRLSFEAFGTQLKQNPAALPHMISGFDYFTGNTKELIIVGTLDPNFTYKVNEMFNPDLTVLYKNEEKSSALEKLVPYLENYHSVDNKTTYYLCENFACRKPVTDYDQLSF